jgi:hypothetical protein
MAIGIKFFKKDENNNFQYICNISQDIFEYFL